MSAAAKDQGFQFLLEGVSRMGGAKALIEITSDLIDRFKPDELPFDEELLFQRIVKQLMRGALDERNAAVAILGEQGIDAGQMLADIEQAIGRASDVDPR